MLKRGFLLLSAPRVIPMDTTVDTTCFGLPKFSRKPTHLTATHLASVQHSFNGNYGDRYDRIIFAHNQRGICLDELQ
jgi:hypothetical protein